MKKPSNCPTALLYFTVHKCFVHLIKKKKKHNWNCINVFISLFHCLGISVTNSSLIYNPIFTGISSNYFWIYLKRRWRTSDFSFFFCNKLLRMEGLLLCLSLSLPSPRLNKPNSFNLSSYTMISKLLITLVTRSWTPSKFIFS